MTERQLWARFWAAVAAVLCVGALALAWGEQSRQDTLQACLEQSNTPTTCKELDRP